MFDADADYDSDERVTAIARTILWIVELKINQREVIKKWNKVELCFLCTALRVIEINMHTNFEVIWTYGHKVMLLTRNAL